MASKGAHTTLPFEGLVPWDSIFGSAEPKMLSQVTRLVRALRARNLSQPEGWWLGRGGEASERAHTTLLLEEIATWEGDHLWLCRRFDIALRARNLFDDSAGAIKNVLAGRAVGAVLYHT